MDGGVMPNVLKMLQRPDAQRFYRQVGFGMKDAPLDGFEWHRPLSPAPFLPPQEWRFHAEIRRGLS